jgi:hypothetical protein
MPTYLLVSQEDPVVLGGTLDAAGELQVAHGSDSLADYEQEIHAEHDALRVTTATIQLRISDFGAWTCDASHPDGAGGSTQWVRGTSYAYADFGEMSDLLEVDVAASNGTTTKSRKIWIKTLPDDGQPDPRG